MVNTTKRRSKPVEDGDADNGAAGVVRLLKAKMKNVSDRCANQLAPASTRERQSTRISGQLAASKIRTTVKPLAASVQVAVAATDEPLPEPEISGQQLSKRSKQATDKSRPKPKPIRPNRSKKKDEKADVPTEASTADAGVVKVKTVHKKRPCEVCGRQFNTFYLAVHRRTHTGEKPFACQQCGKRFSTESLLTTHRTRHHSADVRVLQCDVCLKVFASKGSLKMHSMVHSDQRPYKCQLCDKSFKQPGVLSEHEKTHSRTHSFKCETCGKSFQSRRGVVRHQEITHKGVVRVHQCDHGGCGKVFHDPSSLWRHQKRHADGYTAPLECQLCRKRFHEAKVLATHMLIHSNLKPFKCDFCDKTFRHQSVLKRHTSVHTGIKPFRCLKCNRQFVHRVYLLRHKNCKPKTIPSEAPATSRAPPTPPETPRSIPSRKTAPALASPFAPFDRVPRFALSSRVQRGVATRPTTVRRRLTSPRKTVAADPAPNVEDLIHIAPLPGAPCAIPVVETSPSSTVCPEANGSLCFVDLGPATYSRSESLVAMFSNAAPIVSLVGLSAAEGDASVKDHCALPSATFEDMTQL